jgi:hypothetical protein
MVAANSNDRIPSARGNPALAESRLAQRVRHYFEQQPEVAREEFLLEAVRRGIHFHNTGSAARPPLNAEDIRLHAWLSERLATLHYERLGLWSKLRRSLSDNRLVLWLGQLRSNVPPPR